MAGEIVRQIGGVDMLQAHEAAHREERERNRSFGDIAVLYRTHRQAELMEQYLRQEGIPCVIGGRDSFLSDPAVRGAVCFFRYLMNSEDIRSERTGRRLLWASREDFPQMAEKYAALVQGTRPDKLFLKWAKDMELDQEPSIKKLTEMAGFAKTTEEFLNCLLLGVESDLKRQPGRHYSSDAVHLMTLHGAKGLEFPVVMVCGLKKGLLPLEAAAGQAELTEERRLFYVGMTRAREELILLSPGEPSLFLGELPNAAVSREEAYVRKREEQSVQLSLFDFMI